MPDKTRSVVIGGVAGVAATLLSAIPFVGACFSCFAIVVPGLVAVWHYTNTNRLTLSGGEGVGMGVQAGLVMLGLSSIVALLAWLAMGRPDMLMMMEESVRQNVQGDDDTAEQLIAFLRMPAFLIGIFLFSVVVYLIGGVIGGAIGASLFRNDEGETGRRTV